MKSYLSFISGIMDAISYLKQTMFPQFYVVYLFLQTILAQVGWKIIKIKENCVFHFISLIFHIMISYL